MKVVVTAAQVFLGSGKNASRHRRGEIVEIEGKKVPAWAVSYEEAVAQEKKKAPAKKEPRTMSEMNANRGPEKAFGQEI